MCIPQGVLYVLFLLRRLGHSNYCFPLGIRNIRLPIKVFEILAYLDLKVPSYWHPPKVNQYCMCTLLPLQQPKINLADLPDLILVNILQNIT